MAIGYSPKLPLRRDTVDGYYKLNKTVGEVVRQNIKMVVLTAPGERMMDPDFGVGARNFLFGTKAETFHNLKSRIYDQITVYLPQVQLLEVVLSEFDAEFEEQNDPYRMNLRIMYTVPSIGLRGNLTITVKANGWLRK